LDANGTGSLLTTGTVRYYTQWTDKFQSPGVSGSGSRPGMERRLACDHATSDTRFG